MDPLVKRLMVLYLLLGSTCLSEIGPSCSCLNIPKVNQTELPGSNCSINTFRYKCMDGYVRKAGTSNLIRCTEKGWSEPKLKCIESPLDPHQKTRTHTTSPTTVVRVVDVISSVSSETGLQTTHLPPWHVPASSTPVVTPRVDVVSSVSSETYLEMTTTILPPEASLHTTTLPQSSTKTPSTALTFSTTPLTSHSTPTVTSTTTHRPRSPSSPSFNRTLRGTESVATSVIAPVTVIFILLTACGAGCWFYKRNARNRTQSNYNERHASEEESVPMQPTHGSL